jgi:hypothetical protein
VWLKWWSAYLASEEREERRREGRKKIKDKDRKD